MSSNKEKKKINVTISKIYLGFVLLYALLYGAIYLTSYYYYKKTYLSNPNLMFASIFVLFMAVAFIFFLFINIYYISKPLFVIPIVALSLPIYFGISHGIEKSKKIVESQ